MKKTQRKIITGLILLTSIGWLFTSCQPEDSGDVNQARIWTDYEVFYNSNEDKTHAVARFRFGNPAGTLLELKDPASVTFNGQQMAYDLAYTGHHLEFAGKVNGGTFVYTNTEGTVYTNTVAPFDSISFPAGINTISKSQAYTLTWVGNPLAANETVGIFIGTWTWGQDALFSQSADGATNLVMGTNAMSNLALGQATMYMDRWTQDDATEKPDAGGIVVGKYRAPNATVHVVN